MGSRNRSTVIYQVARFVAVNITVQFCFCLALLLQKNVHLHRLLWAHFLLQSCTCFHVFILLYVTQVYDPILPNTLHFMHMIRIISMYLCWPNLNWIMLATGVVLLHRYSLLKSWHTYTHFSITFFKFLLYGFGTQIHAHTHANANLHLVGNSTWLEA